MKIIQIMPAPGWRVFAVWNWDDDKPVRIDEAQVIGWALVDGPPGRYVQMLISDGIGHDASPQTIEEANQAAENVIYFEFPPGTKLTEQILRDWSRELSYKIKQNRRREQEQAQRKWQDWLPSGAARKETQ